MLDLETLSLDSNACIVSIGAVAFDIETGKTGGEYHLKLNVLEQMVNGANVELDTLSWWSSQKEEAKKKLLSGKEVSVRFALEKLNDFVIGACTCKANDIRIWGNGSGFDNVVLRNLYKRSKIDFALPYWCDCDVRTIVNFMSKEAKDNIKFIGVKHDAIADCKHQIKLVVYGRDSK